MERSLRSYFIILAKESIINYDRNHSFIILATVITVINDDRKAFTAQANGVSFTIIIDDTN